LSQPKREELKVQKKKAILVAVIRPDDPIGKEHALDELRGLVDTADVHVVGTLVQVREKPHPGLCLGTGKVDELAQLVKQHGADLIVFDNALSPGQGRNLEKETDSIIVDRSEVILDIFATRAQTHEAKLQVELAQLLYFRPRLKRLWTHLERIEGGIGTGRGPGEKQIETDRRLIDKRIAELKRKLQEVEKRRRQTVNNRNETVTISLVGYTNAGKSTLMRALTGSDVFVADQLFATLDTRTRRWKIPACGEVLLSDTVGFVRDLPHHLVASFRSTLEEARQANLLLHVVDASHPEAELQIETVYSVLEEIGVDCTNVLLVLNKMDCIEDRSLLDVMRARHENAVGISAVTKQGLDRLTERVAERIVENHAEVEIQTSAGNGKLISYLNQHGEMLQTNYHDSRVTMSCRLPRHIFARLQNDVDDETSIVAMGDVQQNDVLTDTADPSLVSPDTPDN